MLIDWFTVAVQIVNFLILVFLLHRFLYRPVVRHMNEREERIRKRLEEASDRHKEAQIKIDEYERKQEDLQKQAAEKIKEAEDQAKKRRDKLIGDAEKHVENQRSRWLQALEKEKDAFSREFQKRGSQEFLKYVQRALQDLADETLNNRLVDVLVTKIRNLDQRDKNKLQRASREKGLQVRSTFELNSSEKGKLTTIFREVCDKEIQVAFQIDGDLPFGIEAQAGNVRLEWGVATYIKELKSRVMPLLDEKTRRKDESGGRK